jgi:RNA polymerase sigma factor (TIGR02999 family)
VTQLLARVREGDEMALQELLPVVYGELHGIAAHHMRRERPDHTLQPTALVNEAFLRLVGGTPVPFQDRQHFLRTASQAMRRVLVDHARGRNAAKRGGGLSVTLEEGLVARQEGTVDMLVLDDALNRLEAAEPRWARVVELRFFAGLDLAEVAEALDVSLATVKRDWQFAKAWLARQLDPNEGGAPTM